MTSIDFSRSHALTVCALGALLSAACAPDVSSLLGNATSSSAGGASASGSQSSPSSSASGGVGAGTTTSTGAAGHGGGSGGTPCNSGPNDDADGDGWTPAQGDCNDCDPNVNPGAIDLASGASMGVDDDCDGKIDDADKPCDMGLALDDTMSADGAKAMGLCRTASTDGTRGKAGYSWGVLNTAYVLANGNPFPTAGPGLQVGITPTFGAVNAQEGDNMLALSSGHARAVGQADACGMDSCMTSGPHTAPAGFPIFPMGCGDATTPKLYDDVALEVALRSPTNATGYAFAFKYLTFEFPEWVCTQFADEFVALVTPPPTGAIKGNLVFDAMGIPPSSNFQTLDICDPASLPNWAKNCSIATCPSAPNPYCPAGKGGLLNTGFGGGWSGSTGGATVWLETQAPIGGGEEFKIRFAIWDDGDHAIDSTVLIDGFRWIVGMPVTVGTTPLANPL